MLNYHHHEPDAKPRIHQAGAKLPPGWELLTASEDGAMYRNLKKGIQAIYSSAIEKDGRWWMHVSVSKRSGMPTYADLAYIKKHFIGDELKAIQVFAPMTEHVNIHPRCLHLWACLDGDVLPDFTRGTGSI